MRRRTKPAKTKVKREQPPARRSSKNRGSRDGRLQTQLDEVLKREAAALERAAEARQREVAALAQVTEALDRQTATTAILRIIGSSPTDNQPVFETIARSGVAVCAALGCAVLVVDGDMIRVAATHGVRPERLQRFREEYPAPLAAEIDTAQTIRERRVFHLADIHHNPNASPADIENARLAGYQTRLMIPMVRGDKALGLIAVTREAPTPFPDQQVELLRTFADQAVIAIENVRLFNETKEALEQQTATADILRVISTSPTDIHPVFQAIVRSGASLCHAPDVIILIADRDSLRVVASVGPVAESVRQSHLLQGAGLPVTRGSVSGRAFIDRRTVHVNDVGAMSDDEFPEGKILQRQYGGHGTTLAVPLLREDVSLGVITLLRNEVSPFTDRQVAVLQTFADQAVIAIENVRLFKQLEVRNRDLAEALDQQTATSEILRVISQSQTDAQPVFDTIVRSTVRLCDGLFSTVFQFDGELLHVVATHNLTPEGLEALHRAYPARPSRVFAAGRAILERAVVHIPDIELEPEPDQRALARAVGWRSALIAPMMREGAPIGVITAGRAGTGPFSDSEVELLRTFADQAVIAVENVRLFKELEARNKDLTEALEQQTATAQILRVISSSPTDLQPVLVAVAENAARVCGAIDAQIYRVEGELVHWVASHGPIPPNMEERLISRGWVTGRAVADRRTVHVHDLAAESDTEYPVGKAAQRKTGHRTTLATPLLREGIPLGVISIRRMEVRPFSEKQVRLLETFADQAVIAIENVRLFTELQEKNRALTLAHAQVSEALAQQTATSEILRTIAHAQTDTQLVFDTIVQSAARLCRAVHAVVFLTDGRLAYAPASYGQSPEALAAARARFPRPLAMDSTASMAMLTRAIVHVPDIEEPSTHDFVRQSGQLVGFRSVVTVPMLREGEAVGAILVARQEAGRFSDSEVELLRTFADQAVIAVENVRLFKEVEARTAALTRSVDQLTALGEVGRAVSSTLDLETVLTTIVTRAVELSGLDGGVVFEYDEDAEAFVHRAATETAGALAEAQRTTRIRKGEGALGRTASTLEPVQVTDITVPGALESRLRDLLIESGVRAVLAVPMVREGQLIGSLAVTRNRAGDFPAETIELLRTFATQSALAIQNARLFREIEEKSRELEAASRHKSEFLANMSHELRTPLNAVIGFSEVLLQRMFGDLNAKQDEYLKDIYASGQHLLSLINDILDLSKIEAGRMELTPAPFHLPSALDNAVTLVRERATRHGIALEIELDPELGELVGDERKVKQVVLNLLSNAVKFTPEGGRISLKASRTDGAVEIAVSDTGIGIAAEDQATIFEEFRQVGSDETRKQEGTGLGLTLAKKFIELHGGRIRVDSELERGSTFTFTLPMA